MPNCFFVDIRRLNLAGKPELLENFAPPLLHIVLGTDADRGSSLLLADESGRLLRGDAAAIRFVPLATALPTGLTGMVQAADGALIVSGARGASRVEPATLTAEAKQ